MKLVSILNSSRQTALSIFVIVVVASCSGRQEVDPARFAAGWKSAQTEHVIVFEPPDSPRANRTESFAQASEDVLMRLTELMSLDVPDRIEIYRFITNRDCETATGHSAGYVEEYRIYTRIGAPMGGAIALAAFSSVDPDAPSFPMIRDGFREAFDHPTDNLHRRTSELRADGRWLPLKELTLDMGITDREAYEAISASFVAYLIQRHGIEKFKMLWRSVLELVPSLEKIYGGTLEEIEADWIKHLEREAKKT
jgi:hypothetical protein